MQSKENHQLPRQKGWRFRLHRMLRGRRSLKYWRWYIKDFAWWLEEAVTRKSDHDWLDEVISLNKSKNSEGNGFHWTATYERIPGYPWPMAGGALVIGDTPHEALDKLLEIKAKLKTMFYDKHRVGGHDHVVTLDGVEYVPRYVYPEDTRATVEAKIEERKQEETAEA